MNSRSKAYWKPTLCLMASLGLAYSGGVYADTGEISCDIGSSNVWNSGFVLNNIEVTNNSGASISEWQVQVMLGSDSANITNYWNAQVSLDGSTVTANNVSYNGTLADGESTTFGFQGSYSGTWLEASCNVISGDTEETIEEPIDDPIEEPVDEPIEEPIEEPIDEPIEEPVDEPIEEPVDEPIEEPVEEPADDDEEEETEVDLDTTLNFNPALRVNEIVAKDANDGEDWIELYVTGDESVNLSNYTLADESLERLSLPDITLSPGEFYRIYATKDEVEGVDSVAFKLGGSDEVNLYQGDDLIDSLSWKKGQALINYSYGRYPDGSDATQTMTPTAAASNESAEALQLVINEVVANGSGDDWFELYNNSGQAINLSDYQVIDNDSDENQNLPDITLNAGDYYIIYATEDANEGNNVSFTLEESDELSLLKDDETIHYINWDASDLPSGYSYGLQSDASWAESILNPTENAANEAVNPFDSEKVESVYIDIASSDWSDLLNNAVDETYYYADITFKDVTLTDVAFRAKGNSSLSAVANMNSERYSFKIDMNEYVDGQKLLGMKKFVLNNGYNDPSYLREFLAYELMEEMGVAAPKRAFVNLYINNQLHGLYLMVEAIDSEFLEDNFTNSEGDMYKPDGTGSDLLWISDDFNDYEGLDVEVNENTTDHGSFINFVAELNDGDAESVTDYDSLLRYMSVSVALSNMDSYHGTLAHNYYLYEQDDRFTLLPWDFNEAFGTFNMDCNNADLTELYIDEPTSGDLSERPLVEKAFADLTNLDTYHDYLTTLIEGSLSETQFNQRVNEMADIIRDHVANDPTAFYGVQAFETNLTSDYSGFYGLTSFMSQRVQNIQQQLNGTAPSSGTGAGFCSSANDQNNAPINRR